MIIPSKFVRLEESVIARLDTILEQGPDPVRIDELFTEVRDEFESIDQFMLAIDVLYVLRRIEVNFNTRMLTYVD